LVRAQVGHEKDVFDSLLHVTVKFLYDKKKLFEQGNEATESQITKNIPEGENNGGCPRGADPAVDGDSDMPTWRQHLLVGPAGSSIAAIPQS
jgi:hypothetical protein